MYVFMYLGCASLLSLASLYVYRCIMGRSEFVCWNSVCVCVLVNNSLDLGNCMKCVCWCFQGLFWGGVFVPSMYVLGVYLTSEYVFWVVTSPSVVCACEGVSFCFSAHL
jgi:hypothetical protein